VRSLPRGAGLAAVVMLALRHAGAARAFPGMSDDGELVEGLRTGDPRALDACYAAYRAPLASCCGRGQPEAPRSSQETFVRLARYALRLRPDTHLRDSCSPSRATSGEDLRWSWVDGTVAELALGPHHRDVAAAAAASELEARFERRCSRFPRRNARSSARGP
jgi:hypothetical protein